MHLAESAATLTRATGVKPFVKRKTLKVDGRNINGFKPVGDKNGHIHVGYTLEPKTTSQYRTVVLTVVRVMIAKYRKSGFWGYRSSLTPEPVELK